jgi:hypothetical protein
VRRAFAALALVVCSAAIGGCGASSIVLHGHPQNEVALAGEVGPSSPDVGGTAGVSVSVPESGASNLGSGGALPKPESNAAVLQELQASGISADPNHATLTPGGLAIAPINAPAAVQAAINAGNDIAKLPYIWGGGHLVYEDTGYDCSGSLSFILASAGLLTGTRTSDQFMSYGAPGPGKWITIYAKDGHTFAYIAGLRFDTVALAETGSRWSNKPADEPDLSAFVARHPVGY